VTDTNEATQLQSKQQSSRETAQLRQNSDDACDLKSTFLPARSLSTLWFQFLLIPAMSSAAAAASIDDVDELSPQQLAQVANVYQQMRQELTQIGQKVAELEGERKEHQLRFCMLVSLTLSHALILILSSYPLYVF
jgi:hypothetical protein